jgi:hypothetical protein
MADPKDGPVESDHIDEGMAHEWLDGQLPAADAARVEAHIAACTTCAAVVAEARGFVAASSRILTELDDVPARVVPRARPRVRVWQIRAAAAVVVVALGAAAVWSDRGGRLSELTRVAGLSDQPVVAPLPPARAPVDTTAAASRDAAVARAPASDSPSAGLRTAPLVRQSVAGAAPPAVPQSSAKAYASKKQTDRAGEDSGARAMATPSAASQRPAYVQSREAVVAAQSAGAGGQLDAKTAINNASAVDPRWSPAYGVCAGRTVTIPADSSSNGGSIAGRTVRLDSAPAVFTHVSGFVASSPDQRDTSVRGVWVPVGADSAVVSLAPVDSTTIASRRAATRLGNAVGSGVVSARLRCASP